METRNYAPSTLKRTRRSVDYFIAWCRERDLERPTQVTRPILERYTRHLFHLRTATGAPLSFRTQHNDLSTLRCFFRFLARKDYLLHSPANDLELPKLGQRLPRATLTHEEMERVLAQPDVDTDLGVRDRAILETFYSTGIRRSELTNLAVFDLDVARGTLAVRQGKGRKDRVVPVGERALAWIDRYQRDVRPALLVDRDLPALFVSAYGQPLSADALSTRVRDYVDAADLGKKGSCHLFRHTMATLMLERGADVRIIQEILGHSSLDATQIYTHVSIGHLKQVHDATHPAAKHARAAQLDAGDDDPAAT
jgi:integrase/recombinase XerD